MRILTTIAAVLLPLVLHAQEAEPKPQDTGPVETYRVLEDAFRRAQIAFGAGYQEAAKAGAEAAQEYLRTTPRPEAEFTARFRAGAERLAGEPEAVPFLVWLLQNDAERAPAHAKALFGVHVKSPELVRAVQALRWAWRIEPAERLALLDRAVELSPHDTVRHRALHARAEVRMTERDASTREAAKRDFESVIEASRDAQLVKEARADLFELENLQIGMIAPDIEGEDLDGVPFKLSDYRGKVVVLDFWGDW